MSLFRNNRLLGENRCERPVLVELVVFCCHLFLPSRLYLALGWIKKAKVAFIVLILSCPVASPILSFYEWSRDDSSTSSNQVIRVLPICLCTITGDRSSVDSCGCTDGNYYSVLQKGVPGSL